jgi:hypothetical protein
MLNGNGPHNDVYHCLMTQPQRWYRVFLSAGIYAVRLLKHEVCWLFFADISRAIDEDNFVLQRVETSQCFFVTPQTAERRHCLSDTAHLFCRLQL